MQLKALHNYPPGHGHATGVESGMLRQCYDKVSDTCLTCWIARVASNLNNVPASIWTVMHSFGLAVGLSGRINSCSYILAILPRSRVLVLRARGDTSTQKDDVPHVRQPSFHSNITSRNEPKLFAQQSPRSKRVTSSCQVRLE
jgi:hypothetical protein